MGSALLYRRALLAVDRLRAWFEYAFGRRTGRLVLEGPEHMSDRALKRAARIALVVVTVLFVLGLIYPGLKSWGWAS